MLIGMLVDEGTLRWTDLVSDYIPDFALFDEFANARCTVADLLAHKTVRVLYVVGSARFV